MTVTTNKNKDKSNYVQNKQKHVMLPVFPVVPKGEHQKKYIKKTANDARIKE